MGTYKSKFYHKWNADKYAQYKFDDGDMTPILFIFTTYCGDSMSMPVRKMAEYYVSNGWRVVSYTKRGCGSPSYEMLPLANHKPFDLSGMDDAELAIQCVVKRYPLAPKICLGFSLGGSQCQDYLGTLNVRNNVFDGGIKIDGVCKWTESIKFGIQHQTFTKVLGEVVHSNYVKSLFAKDLNDTSIDYEKIKLLQKKTECKAFNFAKIASMKSSDCEILDVVKDVISPAANCEDYINYLHSVGPADIEQVNVPFLVMSSWNDGFQDTPDICIGVANANPNVFHLVTKLGAHCVRREGLLFRECWQSKVSFEFASAVVNARKTPK